jgi:HEAT repeat protein
MTHLLRRSPSPSVRRLRHVRVATAMLLWAGGLLAQGGTADPAADLRNKAIDVRLRAIDAVAASGRKDAEALLVPLLAEKDWEVQERTAEALARLGGKAGLSQLVELALDGDVVRVRRAAAVAAGRADAAEAAARLWKQVKGKHQVAVLEALAWVLRARPTFADADKLTKLLRDPEASVREAAAAAWLEGAADRAAALRTLLAEPTLAVRCRALDAVAEAPQGPDLEPLVAAFTGPGQNDVVGRRLVKALAAVLRAGDGDRAARARSVLDQAGTAGLVGARAARLVAQLAAGESPVFDADAAAAALAAPLGAGETSSRAAAVHALRTVGGAKALAMALQHFDREPDPRVQYQVVETVAALREPTSDDAAAWLVKIAAGNSAEPVRERALVRLGRPGAKGAVETLARAATDPRWPLACTAIVSLGKTHDDAAWPVLQGLLKHPDWKLRGAAVVGAMHWSREAVVEPVLALLADPHPVVARTAHEALRALSRRYDIAADAKAWRAFWAQAKGKHDFTDRETALEKQKKYGYAVSDAEIYRGLDVVVFQSRGDHIEQLLDRLKIAYRTTKAGDVAASGLHPEAIFVANCTGELMPGDLEPLQWFVHTGGYLFGSCWALTETIGKLQGGVMQQAPTRDQVMDNVRALPVQANSPLLQGVFPPAVVPIYHLEGAHLLAVQDPERAEVLIDSPDAAERHGCGNLAGWFRLGHGVLFSSANHFDLQGLEVAPGLKTDKDRQAHAVDHMGLSFEAWRSSRTAAHWKDQGKASKSVPDLSAFRLLTNFVRSKRSGTL